MKILILNAGSSSQKSCFYEIAFGEVPNEAPKPLWEAAVDWTHQAGVAEIKVKTATGNTLKLEVPAQSRLQVTQRLLATLWDGETAVMQNPSDIDVVGHRVVHGGQQYSQPVRITEAVKTEIGRLAVLAPVHNPVNLEGIEAIEQILGADMPQFAVFDTAFHRDLPEAAAIYPGPYEWVERGIRRYGFHGISHAYCADRAAQLLQQELSALRLIICHLGNGCSLSAVHQGHCIDTTMGFTPLDGLMMGARSGAVDPGILIHLVRQEGYTADQLDLELNQTSGLKGISGISSDLRAVMEAIEVGNPRAQLALDIYLHRLRSCMGSMLASLGGVDAIVFTAGVGENSAIVRARACAAFGFLGLQLDEAKNQARPVDLDIATAASTVRVLVIHTQEDWAIAKACYQCLSS